MEKEKGQQVRERGGRERECCFFGLNHACQTINGGVPSEGGQRGKISGLVEKATGQCFATRGGRGHTWPAHRKHDSSTLGGIGPLQSSGIGSTIEKETHFQEEKRGHVFGFRGEKKQAKSGQVNERPGGLYVLEEFIGGSVGAAILQKKDEK